MDVKRKGVAHLSTTTNYYVRRGNAEVIACNEGYLVYCGVSQVMSTRFESCEQTEAVNIED